MGFILVPDIKPQSTDFTLPIAPVVVAIQAQAASPAARLPKMSVAQPSTVPTTAPHALSASNRRWSPRTAFGKPGVIGSGSRSGEPISCTVCDISRQGALLEVETSAAAELPNCFVLVFYNRRTRSEVNCVVRWQRNGKIGVCFAGPVHSTVDRR